MKILSNPILDKKIMSYNILVEMTLIEYYKFIKETIFANEFQRNKVRSSKTIYALLKQDLMAGCIIPPIVLAMDFNLDSDTINDTTLLERKIIENKDKMFILDGLQRTFTKIGRAHV